MSLLRTRPYLLFAFMAALIVGAVSCNSKDDDDENEIVVTPAIVAVKNFYLQANDSVLKNLDSVFFSIDLETGVIFNADSLPKGTDVTRLIPSITFSNSMSRAELKFLKDGSEEVVVDYLTHPTDSIDFTNPVTLDVTAQDGINTYSYLIRVNVHKQNPDTIVWANLEKSTLPSRFPEPLKQKTIERNNVIYTLIEEGNGEYTLATGVDINSAEWDKMGIEPGFNPDVESFNATPEYFFMLSEEGELYESLNGEVWTDTGENWHSILGCYGNSILGVANTGSTYVHTQYPQPEGFRATTVEAGFPVSNSSGLGVVETKWASNPTAILACGLSQDGLPQNSVWAYDGTNWAMINNGVLPGLVNPMMARYVAFRDTPRPFIKREFDVWMLFGGVNAEGAMNRTVYISYDNGVNWLLAPSGMSLPIEIPSLSGSDVIVAGNVLEADLSDAWTRASSGSRAAYTVDGYIISWNCPYIYIFGGQLPNEQLSTDIWRGVLNRLTFTPDI